MKETLRVLNELKERGLIKDYAIGGGIAALRWVEPFFTQDLDIFVLLEQETTRRGVIDLSPLISQGQGLHMEGAVDHD